MGESIRDALAAERRLAQKLGDFEGRWVAVRDHQVVFSADTLHWLTEEIGEEPVDGCFLVPATSGASYFASRSEVPPR